jgi:hypothetical protein
MSPAGYGRDPGKTAANMRADEQAWADNMPIARITECEECGAVIAATRRFCDQDCINTNRRREATT